MKHGRLTWYEPGALTDEQRILYESITGGPRSQGPRTFPLTDEAGRLHGPFNAMLASPEVGAALQELGAAIRYRTSLPARARELAILEVAAARRSDFEWYAHERVGKSAGLTDRELAAVREGAEAPTLDAAEQLIRRVVQALLNARDVDDALFAQAQAEFGERGLMEVVALVGYYELLALSLRVWRTPLPGGAALAFG